MRREATGRLRASWVADLRAAGFADVRHRLLSDYWWAPAHLIGATARPR